MRPPLNAGENRRARRLAGARRMGFNEAPAERGGKHGVIAGTYAKMLEASMRPPLNAGENRDASSSSDAAPSGFNEAPAERGGKRDGPPPASVDDRELQ